MPNDTYDHSADASKIISGEFEEYIVTHPGRSQYSQVASGGGGVSACGLAALNCARIVLGLHSVGMESLQLVQELTKRPLLEDILRPCLSWSSSAHLAVDDIHKAPIFKKSLQLVSSDYGMAGLPFFKKLFSVVAENTKQRGASSCVIITRPPEIIACFCIADTPADLFVIFDSHPRPDKHPHGAAFIFKNSVDSTAKYLAELLRYDQHILSDSTVQWQAQLLAHCSGDIFFARNSVKTNSQWSELALNASLQVLSLQGRVRDLETKNEALETDNKRLNEEVSQLEDRMLELDDEFERLKMKYERTRASQENRSYHSNSTQSPRAHQRQDFSRSPVGTFPNVNRHPVPPAPPDQRSAQRQQSTEAHTKVANLGADSLVAYQLQMRFNEEDRQLQQQLQGLKHIQPTFFDCGVCFERYEEDHVARVMPCGHPYCRSCLRDYAVSKIKDHRFPILCPTCTADKDLSEPGELDDVALQQLGLTNEQYGIYNEMQLSRFSTTIHCRKCLNTIFVDKTEYQEAQEIVCPLRGCGYAWCKLCSQAIEIGGPKHSCDGSSELKDLMVRRGWKHCPGCQTPAEKIDGCNHMTCMSPGCNAHFCYVCGESIVQSVLRREIESAVSQHYRRCTLF